MSDFADLANTTQQEL